MLTFNTDSSDLKNDLNEVIRQFFAYHTERDFTIIHRRKLSGGIIDIIDINNAQYLYEYPLDNSLNNLSIRRYLSRTCKLSLYKALESHLGRSLPWGSLTGVRPTKLAYELLENGIKPENIAEKMQKEFLVKKEKSELIGKIINAQKQYFTRDSGSVDLYIHIPLCPSKCNYCSFISQPLDKQKNLVEPYINALVKEIETTFDMIEKMDLKIHSVYVGGGTPTAISDGLLDKVLSSVKCKGIEFTCEAGRPETITESNLEVMKKNNVTRISVNPQTLRDRTLELIGRNHTVNDFYKAYEKSEKFGFIINVDLIAGLKSEKFDDFFYSLKSVEKLSPHNVTVHTLSQKNGAELKLNKILKREIVTPIEEQAQISETEKMMDYAHSFLESKNYLPYYLYRQKLMIGNLENAGYCKDGFQCINNISTMEESLPVIACGAGGISKRIINGEKSTDNRIERLANIKDIKLYIEQFDERLIKKLNFFKN